MQKRVLALHDISCFGRCSLTVALPIISAAGFECTVLPNSILSAHTGIPGFTFRDLTDEMGPISDHWKRLGLKFDAVFTGFLCNREQVDITCDLIDNIRHENTFVMVDPAMADGGQLYPTFDSSFPEHMRKLCSRADAIKPNITEACLMTGTEYREGPYSEEWISALIRKVSDIGARNVILTGVFFNDDQIGAAVLDRTSGKICYRFHEKIPGYYVGTGDIFSSVLVSGVMKGFPLGDAVQIAVDFTADAIRRTYDAGTDPLLGVNFEEGLQNLITRLNRA